MTAEEMRILFQQKYQKKDQNRARGITDDEIDIWLNDAQDTLVDEIVNGRSPSFAKSTLDKRNSDLRRLLKTVYLDAKPTTDSNIKYRELPADFAYPAAIAFKGQLNNNTCCSENCNLKNIYIKEHYAIVELNYDLTQFPNIENPIISITAEAERDPENVNPTTITLIENDPMDSSNPYDDMYLDVNEIKENEDINIILNFVLGKSVEDPRFSIYWERYGGEYHKNSFIIIFHTDTIILDSGKNYIPAENITDNTSLLESTLGTTDDTFNDDLFGRLIRITIGNSSFVSESRIKQRSYSNKAFFPALVLNDHLVHGKTTSPERIERHVNHPFKKSNINSILYILKDGIIEFYQLPIYLVHVIKFNYFRRLQRISNKYNVTCELPEEMHREVVDLAVSRLLQSVGSQRYQTKLTDIQLNNNN